MGKSEPSKTNRPKRDFSSKKEKKDVPNYGSKIKSRKRKLDFGPEVAKENPKKTSSSSGTLESFFAKAKPVESVSCPICFHSVKKTLINKHLDGGCLIIDKKSVLLSSTEDLSDTGLGKGKRKRRGKNREDDRNHSPEKGLAKLKTDLKDLRKQEKLKQKIKLHERYQNVTKIKAKSEKLEKELHGCADELSVDATDVQNGDIGGTKSPYFKSSRNTTISQETVLQDESVKIRKIGRLSRKGRRSHRNSKSVPNVVASCSSKGSIGCENSQNDFSLDSVETVVIKDLTGKDQPSSADEFSVDLESARSVQGFSPDMSTSTNVLSYSDDSLEEKNELSAQDNRSSISETKFSVSDETNSQDTVTLELKRHLSRTRKKESEDLLPSLDNFDSAREVSCHSLNKSEVSMSSLISVKAESLSSLQDSSANVELPFKSEISISFSSTSFSSFQDKLKSTQSDLSSPQTSMPSTQTDLPSTPKKSDSLKLDAISPSSSRSSQGSPHKPKEPYYVTNFKVVLNTVLGNEDDRSLLNEKDLEAVAAFNQLSVEAQQLYIRIFQRKFAWLRVSRIDYPKIAVDLAPFAEELCRLGLFIDDQSMTDVEEMLKLILAPDLKLLAKELKVNLGSGQKSDNIAAIIKHCCQQKGLFGGNLSQVLLKKAKKFLGKCIKLEKEGRAVFTRICLLFSPVLMTEEEDKSSGGQSQLQTLLLVNFGKVSFPPYTINRTRKLFRTREDLLRYELAVQYYNDISAALSTNHFELAYRLWQSAKATYEEFSKDKDITSHDQNLPVFLQCFTASSVYTSILYQGVEILQKMRRYQEAVDVLKNLLSSSVYRTDCHGRWWERLALNLDQHLKNPDQALDAVKEGLDDVHVTTGHRLALRLRAEKILKAPSNKKLAQRRSEEFEFGPLRELPELKIQGPILPYTTAGVKTTFYRPSHTADGEEDGVEICRVEQIALDHYLSNGFTNGKHGEGSIFSTLIFLLFCDEILMDVPDVFSYPYQSCPLDLRTNVFFSNREKELKEKLQKIREADGDTLGEWFETVWVEHEEESLAGVSWTLFTLQEAKELLSCMGGAFVSAVAERILRDHRHCRGGMPDLIVWNSETKAFKMSEVKGPGDRLAQKQILWIDFFLSIGADAEVCYVEGVKSKQLKKPIKKSPRRTPRKFGRRSSQGTPKKSLKKLSSP